MCWQGSMISRSRQRAARNLQHRTPWYRKQKDRKNYSIRLSDQKLFLLQNLDAWIYIIYSEDVHWWNSTKGDQNVLTDITLGLQNPRAATTSRTNVQLGLPVSSWLGAVQGQPSTVPAWPRQTPPGHAARGDKAALPRRGAWQWVATRDPGWWPCNRITWNLQYLNTGWVYPTRMSQNLVSIESIYKKKTE